MKHDNLFVIGSGALQLVNALEAFDHFLDEDAAPTLIISNRERRHPEEHKKLVNLKNWGKIHWLQPTSAIGMLPLPLRFLRYRHHTLMMHRLLAPYRGCERLFLAQYSEFNRHLALWLKPREIVYITDGMEVAMSSLRRSQALKSDTPSLKKKIRSALYGWRDGHPDSMVFFSALEPTVTDKDRFVENRYQFVARQFGVKDQKRKAVIFIGQPLYPPLTDRYSFDNYWSKLETLVETAGVTEYWPHPKEDPEFVAERCKELGIERRTSPYPLEIALLELGCPERILSYFSSALYTCKSVFAASSPEVHYIEVDEHLEKKYNVLRAALKSAGVEAFRSSCEQKP